MDLKKLFVWVPSSVTFDGAAVSTANREKIYFDSKNSVIWVAGTSFGASAGDIATLQTAINTLNGDADKEGSVANAVHTAIANLINSAPESFDTLKEIADWIGDDTKGHIKEAAEMVTAISANTAAIGTATVGETAGTGLTKRIEDLEAANANRDLTKADTAVAGKYVSAVSQAKDGSITVTREDLPELSVADGSADFISASGHAVGAKTVNLVDTLGMTKGADGTWSAGSASGQANGLATAADVAAEIVADEEVIAAALNDHEARIAALQGSKHKTSDVTAGAGKVVSGVHVAEDGGVTIDSVDMTTVAEKTTGHVTVSTSGAVVTIAENDIASAATYKTEVTDKLLGAATVSGSVAEAKAAADAAQTTADGIKTDLEAFSWWETYSA